MVSDQELRELDLWIRNAWSVEEKELFYSTVFRLNSKEAVKENEEEIAKLRELIAKKYEEKAERIANDLIELEDAVKDIRLEVEELEAKLNNKENYLIKNFPVAIINANLQNVIDNCNKSIEQYEKEKEELIEKIEQDKDNYEERLTEIEEEINSLRVKNISVTTDEELEEIRKKYNDLLEEKSNINKTLKEYEEGTIESKLEEIDRKIKFEEIKSKKYEELQKENLKYATEDQYDQEAIENDELYLEHLKDHIDIAENAYKDIGNVDFVDVFDRYVKSKENPIFDEEPVKVVKSTAWEWVKSHKKQILIALGLTALTISVVVLATQVLPALVAASEAANTAGLMSQMMANSSLWQAASVGEQAALHSANIALANQVTAVSGMANAFNAASGAWTIGGQTLAAAANTATLAATKAAGTATLLQGLGIATGLGGVGLVGAGLLPNKSEEYKIINEEIKKLKSNYTSLEEIEFQNMAEQIDNRINNSQKLSAMERKMLLKKFASVLRKRAKYNALQQKKDSLENKIDNLENEVQFEQNVKPYVLENILELSAGEPVDNPEEMKAFDEEGNVVDVEIFENGNIYEIDENGNIILPNEEKAKTM